MTIDNSNYHTALVVILCMYFLFIFLFFGGEAPSIAILLRPILLNLFNKMFKLLHGEHTRIPQARHLQIFMRYPHMQVPIYTPGSREAIEIKHVAQECEHDDPTRIRTRDPLMKSPTPNTRRSVSFSG